MMILIVALLAFEAGGPVDVVEPSGVCVTDDTLKKFIGKRLTSGRMIEARRMSGAAVAREISPGRIVTTEFDQKRLTLVVDARRVVTRLICG